MKKKRTQTDLEKDIARFGIPKSAWYNPERRKDIAPELCAPHWKENLNKFDMHSQGFRQVVALSPIKSRIRRLEICATDRVAIFKDYATPCFWSINKDIKKSDNVFLRVLFPGEPTPRILPIKQVKLYNESRQDDRDLVSEYNSYTPDVYDEKDKLRFYPRNWTARFRYWRYLYAINKLWRRMRTIKKLHLVGTNAVFREVMM